MDLVSICESLLKRNEIEPFLKQMIRSDEKWITYDNKLWKVLWSKAQETFKSVANPRLMPREVMLSVWWVEKDLFIMSCSKLQNH